MSDQEAIAGVIGTFFAGFTPDLAGLPALREVLLPEAVITRLDATGPVSWGVEDFIAPRAALLAGGTLEGFREWEVEGTTEVIGDLAQHRCSYAKSWQGGTGAGVKAFTLVRTTQGWRISSAAWSDA